MKLFKLETPDKHKSAKKIAKELAELIQAAFEYRMPPIVSSYQVYQRMKDPNYNIYCCTENDTVIGVAFVSPDNLIEHLSVIPWRQGKGIGKILLRTVILQNVIKSGNNLTLVVKKGNKAAIGLYKKHGFVVTEDRGPAAVVMERKGYNYERNL